MEVLCSGVVSECDHLLACFAVPACTAASHGSLLPPARGCMHAHNLLTLTLDKPA
jgi:hypothetical protein